MNFNLRLMTKLQIQINVTGMRVLWMEAILNGTCQGTLWKYTITYQLDALVAH